MILSTTALTALLKATDKAIPEVGDNELTVPQGLSLIHEPLLPLDYVQSSVTVQNGSFIVNDIRALGASAGAGAQTLATLAPGLWRIEIESWGSSNNFSNNGLFYTMTYQGSTVYLHGFSFFNTLYRGTIEFRFLLREQTQLLKNWAATGVGENANLNSVVVCTREL